MNRLMLSLLFSVIIKPTNGPNRGHNLIIAEEAAFI